MPKDMFDDCHRRVGIDRERKALVDRMNQAREVLKALEAERAEVEARIARRIKASGDPDASVSIRFGFDDYTINLGPRDEVQVRNSRYTSWPMFLEKPEEEAGEAGGPVESAVVPEPFDDDPCVKSAPALSAAGA